MSDDRETGLISHLVELRSRVLKMVGAVAVVFVALFPFANQLYEYLSAPLLSQAGASMVAVDVASPFLTPLKLCLLAAFVLSVPVVLYQIWAFVAPGLYPKEKRLTVPLTISSAVLFYLGMMFAYFVVFPLMFRFFTAAAPTDVAIMTDIKSYLDFVVTIFLAFGLAFEVPVVTVLLIRSGVVTADDLAAKRPYIIVFAFVLGMALTPPDVISQVLLAVPIWLLFELGLLVVKIMPPAADEESDEHLHKRSQKDDDDITRNTPEKREG